MLRGVGKSITFKWMIFSVLLATLPLAVAGGNIFQAYRRNLKASVTQIQKEKASMVVERINGFVKQKIDSLFLIAINEHFEETHASHLETHLKSFLLQDNHFLELAFLDPKGVERFKVSTIERKGTSEPIDPSMSQMFQVTSNKQIYYGDFKYSANGQQTMVVAVPVEESDGRPIGVLKGRIYLEPMTDLLHQSKIGEKGSAYVMDSEGYLVAHPHEKNILMGPFVDRVIAGEEGSLEFENLRGERFLVVYKPIPELKWGVIVQIPVEEVYAPLGEMTRAAAKWGLIAFLSALAISLFLSKRFTSPIKKLSDEMAKVSGGNLDVHIEPATRDEVGILTGSFNRMIRDLKQSQQTILEAEEKYRMIFENSKDMVFITSVDGRFMEINQAGAEMLGYSNREAMKGLRVGDTYLRPEERKKFQEEVAENGFAKDFEVKLKKKDGTPLDCLITATARKNKAGRIIGYEGTIKNISYRKRMEEELIRRKEETQTLYELSSLVNQSLDLDQVIPVALERVLTFTGFEMGTIYLLSEDQNWLELKFQKNYPSHLAEVIGKIRWGEGVAGSAAARKRVVIFSIDEYPSPRILTSLKEEGIQTLVGIPLLSKGEAVGGICLSTRSARLIEPKEVHLLEGIGNQIGLALENAKLFSAVAKAKSEWETTFDTVTDLITIRDRDYRVLRANRAAFERWGLEPEKIIGKKCYEILHGLLSPCRNCYVEETLKAKGPVSGERESDYLNGMFRYYTYPVYGPSGEIIAVVDMAREITEEKRLEREKEAVNRINKLLASSFDVRGVAKEIHAEFKKVLHSDRMSIALLDGEERRFRYFVVEQDYAGTEFIPGMTYPKEGTPISKAMETGQPVVLDDIFGSEGWLEQRLFQEGIRSSLVYPLEYQGKIIGTLNFDSKDVHRYSEKDLHFIRQIAPGLAISIQNILLMDEIRGSEEKYRAVVEGAHDGICVIGSDNRIKFANKGLAEIWGYSLKEILGKDFRDLLNEEGRRFIAGRFERRERGERLNPSFELEALRKNGDLCNIEINARVMKDPEKRRDYIVFVKDVTGKKKMEEQLLQSEKLRALGEMASGVAHDFNNALAAILGNAQLLLYQVQEEDARESLKTIEKVAKDSAQTVKRLQEFTRKRIPQELFKLDINSIIRDVIEITRPKWKDEAQGKGIQVQVTSHLGEVPGVLGNGSEIREVVINLVFNAIEAMPGGGRIEIHTFLKGESVHVRIADTGIGISEENKKKIFEPFFTTKPFTNTGLGLSMSYGIIKRFGGEIHVESKVGSGTAFTIVLPIAVKEKEETVSNPSIRIGKQARILVIDDEETVRSVLSKMLSQVNHQVTVAMSGAEGVRLFQEKEFDMVLTDLGMPGMSGWDVCKSIKKINPAIPVGMITGWGLEVDKSRKDEAGLDFVITKPFDFQQIVTVVSEKIESTPSLLS